MLTIVAYHYVRDLPRSRYPRFNGLNTKDFDGQLDYISKHYIVCSIRDVVSAFQGKSELPRNACLLTFDDGFIDHYLTVFPRLEARGLTGSFYPVVQAAENRKLLNTHKIHFVLSSTGDHRKVIEDIFGLLEPYRKDHDIPDNEDLYKTYTNPPSPDGDPADTVFIKRVQHVLPDDVRTGVLDGLFDRYVDDREETLADELYMDLAQLQCMVRQGMEVGGHGDSHVWLTRLSGSELEDELSRTVNFLTRVNGDAPQDWAMDYPNGRYNEETIELLRRAGCAVGLTTKVDLVHDLSNPFELNRLDTNDLPFSGDAEICEWTRKVQLATA